MTEQVPQNDELLYHYTSLDAFQKILESRKLWASHIRYMNDTSEQSLLWDQVRTRIATRLQWTVGVEHEWLERLYSSTESPSLVDTYVICFSKDGGDRLSQWRGYGGGAGVSIGFDVKALRDCCSAFTTRCSTASSRTGFNVLAPVVYISPMRDKQSAAMIDLIIKQFIDVATAPSQESKDGADRMFAMKVSMTASDLKDRAFDEELEWRIRIYDLPDGFVKYRTRKSMLVPYAPFALGDDLWPLISRVVVGASAHQSATVAAIKKWMPDQVKVEASVIPYRDW
jgi:hypothetical protein